MGTDAMWIAPFRRTSHDRHMLHHQAAKTGGVLHVTCSAPPGLHIRAPTKKRTVTQPYCDTVVHYGRTVHDMAKGSGGVSLHKKPKLTISISDMALGVCTH